MKKLISLILATMLLATIIPLSALNAFAQTYEGSCGENATWSFDDSTGTLTISGSGAITSRPWKDYTNQITTVVVNEGIEKLCGFAFEECRSLTTVSLPSTLTGIEFVAFYNCENLTTINIPQNITYIDNEAFEGCTSLTEITLPKKLETIGYDVFRGCVSLKTLTVNSVAIKKVGSKYLYETGKNADGYLDVIFGKDVTSIPDYMFNGHEYLKTVTFLGEKVESIGWYAFKDCANLETVTLPKSVKTIGDEAFYNCTSFKTFTLPEKLETIGANALRGCVNVKTLTVNSVAIQNVGSKYDYEMGKNADGYLDVIFGKDVTSIPDYMFNGQGYVKTVAFLGNKVEKIGSRAFANCTSLESIHIPEGVKIIGESAFEGCTSLKEITIPESVTDIYNYAFKDCTKVEVFNFNAIDSWGHAGLLDSKQLYTNMGKETEKGTTVYVGENVECIHGYFNNGAYISHFVFKGNKIKEIREYAFNDSSRIESITYPGALSEWEKIEFATGNGNIDDLVVCTGVEPYPLGDVNMNGAIDARDYVMVKRAYFKTAKLSRAATNLADVNQNGSIDARDYVLLKRVYFKTAVIK